MWSSFDLTVKSSDNVRPQVRHLFKLPKAGPVYSGAGMAAAHSTWAGHSLQAAAAAAAVNGWALTAPRSMKINQTDNIPYIQDNLDKY